MAGRNNGGTEAQKFEGRAVPFFNDAEKFCVRLEKALSKLVSKQRLVFMTCCHATCGMFSGHMPCTAPKKLCQNSPIKLCGLGLAFSSNEASL